MSFNVVVTDGFKKRAKGIAKKHRSLKSDLDKLINSLEENPTQGEPLGKDCYKVRMAITSKGKGKSGGSRVITCVKIVNQTAYLLTIYDKSDKENISDKELGRTSKVSRFVIKPYNIETIQPASTINNIINSKGWNFSPRFILVR